MFEASQWVWMDGEIVAWKDVSVHVSAHALHYGTGVFEGIRCCQTAGGPALFRLDAHLECFYASAAVYGMSIPFPRNELADGICELIRRHGFTSYYARPICYRGSETLGLLPDKCPIHVSAFWCSRVAAILGMRHWRPECT